ncbi:hypothetical protein MMC12_007146 [Toensbergia leucococca]|nr:hypothetical protein [Toensbergia leucococca]
MLLTGLAWSIASSTSPAAIVLFPLVFVFIHFLAGSLLVATAAFFLVGRLLGPGIAGLPGRRRQQGLFAQAGEGEQLEFGYCFDVAIRAFFPTTGKPLSQPSPKYTTNPQSSPRLSIFFGNTLYLVALGYYTIITFLGYNGTYTHSPFPDTRATNNPPTALPFLHHTELLLSPTLLYTLLWFASLFGFNIPKTIAPLLVIGAR